MLGVCPIVDTLGLDRPDTTRVLDAASVEASRNRAVESSSPLRTVSSAQIERLGMASADEALKTIAGISVRDYGGIGGMKTVSVRGMGAQHTSVFYDGIQMSDLSSGTADLNCNNFVKVKNIKVLFIGNEDIFRSASQIGASGAVEMESVAPSFEKTRKDGRICPTNLIFQARYGSFQTVNPQLLWEQRLGSRMSLSTTLDYAHSNGDYPYTVPNGSATETLRRLGSKVDRGRGEVNLYANTAKGTVNAKLMASYTDQGLPGAAILYTQNPTEHTSDLRILASAGYKGQLTEELRLRAYASWNYSYTNYRDSSKIYSYPLNDHYRQNIATISATAEYTPLRGLAIALAEDLTLGHLLSDIAQCPNPTRLQTLTALSARYTIKDFSVTGSLTGRWMKDFVQDNKPPAALWRLSPALSMSYKLPKGFRIRASLRDGYRVPTFNDLYWTRIGNRSLRPEKAFQSNLGLSWSGSTSNGFSASVTLDGFCNKVKDKIVATPTLFVWRMHNLGSALMAGAELCGEAHWKVHPDVTLHAAANYSYMYAVDTSDPEASNYLDQIRYTPRNSGNGHFSLETSWFTASYLLNAVGERWFGDENAEYNYMEPYWDHGISLSHEFSFASDLRLKLGVEGLNLGGKNYEIVRSYPMPGRQFRLTLKLTY